MHIASSNSNTDTSDKIANPYHIRIHIFLRDFEYEFDQMERKKIKADSLHQCGVQKFWTPKQQQ